MKCSDKFKKKRTQKIARKYWNMLFNYYMSNGGLPEYAYRDYMKQFKKEFMKKCKTIKQLKH